jgi:hypothetical protein
MDLDTDLSSDLIPVEIFFNSSVPDEKRLKKAGA